MSVPQIPNRCVAAVVVAGLLLVSGCRDGQPQPGRQPTTVVLLVRHGEKAPGSGDVPLSDEGRARANALAELGRIAGVDAVVTTQFARTRQTAAPLAEALHLTPEVVEVQSDVSANATATADLIRDRLPGHTVLVVGHSNSVPAIAAALGGAHFPDLCDAEYDALVVVVIEPGAPTREIRSRYGAPSPREECRTMR